MRDFLFHVLRLLSSLGPVGSKSTKRRWSQCESIGSAAICLLPFDFVGGPLAHMVVRGRTSSQDVLRWKGKADVVVSSILAASVG